jgi:hypothetical protein
LLPELESPNRLGAYFRHEFSTSSPSSGFALEMIADDGAKVYLDGNEILSLGCCVTAGPGTPAAYDDVATTAGDERNYRSYRVLEGQTLAAGNHILAVGIHNRTARDSDLGFSLRFEDGLQDFITRGADYQYLEGYEEPSNGTLDWTLPGFDDSGWQTGNEAFGYEQDGVEDPNGVYTMVDAGTLLDMQDLFTSLYLRRSFTANNVDELGDMTFTIDYDDNFFAYINGQLVFSSNAHPLGDPTLSLPFDQSGTDLGLPDHESTNNSAALPNVFTVDLADFPGLLNNGDNNVLAIHGINTNLTSSDFLLAKMALYAGPKRESPGVPGDFDADGLLTGADIDDLTSKVAQGNGPATHDLNNDGSVNEADIGVWVKDLFKSWIGDANMDHEFSSSDLVTVLASGTYESGSPSVWTTGDFNGDGITSSADLVSALADGGYEAGRPAVSAVPEPTSAAGLLIGLLTLALRRRS